MHETWRRAALLVAFCTPLGYDPAPAAACGCFTPPDATTPIVQAGERILFSQDGGQVTAHIQIQYSGSPADFGWLLPLPSVPTKRSGEPGVELGVDELFTQLQQTTQPRYQVAQVQNESCGGGGSSGPVFGCGAFAASEDTPGTFPGPQPAADMAAANPLVATDSVGPYDFAILKADSKDAMLAWLAMNRYFVPAGTTDAVGPYIRPGAFFLALRLRAGQSKGDLQPVVVRYQSDLPMIPLVLTATGATPNMGIQVWMLGRGRAIPRNYYHLVLNDGQIDWFTAQNYNQVVIGAVAEAPEHHAFVTEYAGTSAVMQGALLPSGRFGDNLLHALEGLKDPVTFTGYLPQVGFTFGSQLFAVLGRYIPMPQALIDQRLQPAAYYQNLAFYLRTDRASHPERYTDIEAALAAFDPVKAVSELRDRIITPTRDADGLFLASPYLTRLYTTLSPEDMTKDPVFAENPGLPDVPLQHQGSGLQKCDGSFVLTTELGAVVKLPGQGQFQAQDKPFARRIEVLRETGAPEVIKDNGDLLGAAPDAQMPVMMGSTAGCDASKGMGGTGGRGAAAGRGAGLLVAALGAGWLLLRGRRRRPFDTGRVSG